MDLQKMIDLMGEASGLTRSEYHVTLGALISALEGADKSLEVRTQHGKYLGEEDSYRGYYSDLAFEPSSKKSYVDGVLEQCKAALGNEYYGYKGGEFVMSIDTPLWLANYGQSGAAIIFVEVTNDAVVLTTKDIN